MPAATSPESIDFLQQLLPGQKLAGCYLLVRPISGAPGRTIWLANDEVLGKDVALYFLPQELVGETAIAERLRQEVKRSRPLIHPHILRTYDFIEEDGWSAVSTDAFEGPTLAGRLEDGAREVVEIRPWVEQLCETLNEAHRVRIMHAALSPFDITINAKGEAKVMNFGISAVIREAQRTSRPESCLRALSYASPEQLAGGKATVADDIFALGAVIHELLAGEPPFQGEDRKTAPPTIKAHREALGHRGDPVSASWERAVAAALSRDAKSRPTSATRWLQMATTPFVEEELETDGPSKATAALVPIEPSSVEPPVHAAADNQSKVEAPPASGSRPAETTQSAAGPIEATASEVEQAVPDVSQAQPAFSSTRAPEEDETPKPEGLAREAGREHELEAKAKAALEPEPASTAKAVAPKDEIPSEEKGARTERKPGRFRSETITPGQERGSTPVVSAKRYGADRSDTVPAKSKHVAAIPAEDLAETVRREEAEQEARELGYYGDDEDYVAPGRKKIGGARAALPIIGAAVGLLILFGIIKFFVGSPDTGTTRSSTTSSLGTPAPAVPASSNEEPKTVPAATGTENTRASDTTRIASVPEAAPKVQPSPEPSEIKATPQPLTSKVDASLPVPAEPEKTPAEEREAALQKVKELEIKLASAKKEIEGKSKALPQILKGADEIAAQQKRREDAAKKAEQAADQAEQTATEKRRIADETRKAATDLAEQNKTRREEHTKMQELLTTLHANLGEDEKALADARDLAAAAAQREEAAAKKSSLVETQRAAAVPPPLPSAAPSALVEKEDSEAAKARNEERKRIDEEMNALRQKLAEQAKKLGAALDTPRPTESPVVPAPIKSVDPLPLPTKEEPGSTPSSVTPSLATPTAIIPDLALNKPTVPSLAETPPKPAETPKVQKTAQNGEFMNSLGMKFVAVPGCDVTFCIWPTRVRDFESFARTTGLKSTLWKDPGFKQGPEHPVVNVTWQEAVAFCKWLTLKDQKEGILSPDQGYRLPTDLEWSLAVGLNNEPGRTPEERDMSVPDVYPWGSAWPPPQGAGNYTGEETGSDVAIKGYDDGYPWTSPVGSFPANQAGLFDMGGNVWEWCMDTWNSESKARVLRGASWYNGALKLSLLSSCRVHASPDSGTDNYGFRVVIAKEGGKTKR